MNTRILTLSVASAALLGLAACNSGAETQAPAADATAEAPAATTGTVVAVAQGNPDFTTLVSAVQAAGLVDTLNGAGPFTVFAPTNAAFEKIPAATRESLMAPAGKDDLRADLFRAAVDAGLTLLELRQHAQNLEQIFRDLTLTSTEEPDEDEDEDDEPSGSSAKGGDEGEGGSGSSGVKEKE